MTHLNHPGDETRFDDPSDDPRLTAYALGELAGPEHAAARAAIEAQLGADPAARAFVEETRDLAITLRDGYLAAPAASLTDAQRASVMARAAAGGGDGESFSAFPPRRACDREPVGGGKAEKLSPSPEGRVLRVSNWSMPVAAAAAILVGVAFSLRHEIGGWWSGERETARGSMATFRYQHAPGGLSAATPPYYSFNTSTYYYGSGGGAGGGHGVRVGDYHFPESWGDVQAKRAPPPDGAKAAEKPASVPGAAATLESSPGPGGYLRKAWLPGPKVPPLAEADPGAAKGGAGGPGGGKSGDFFSGVTAGGGGGGGGSGAPVYGAAYGGAGGDTYTVFKGGTGGPVGDKTGNGVTPALGDRPVLGTLLEVPGDRAAAAEVLERLQALGYVGSVNTATWGDDQTAPGTLAPGASRFTVNFNHTLDPDLIRRLVADGQLTPEQAEVLGRFTTQRREQVAPGESYAAFADNPFLRATDAPLSTFGIDVDTASYANVRRFLANGQLPPPQAVRIEEMVNYFPYRYAPPTDGSAFAANVEVAGCPWEASHRLVRVALKGRVEDMRERPAANLVFLIDVSGSMADANKLPLLLQSMKQLIPALGERDKVAIVTYAGEAGVALPPTRGDQKDVILAALGKLTAGGSTNGAAGIETAYRLATEGFVQGGVNRVILATDGDFNVGVSDDDALVRVIEEKAKSKVFLSVLGFGEGNLQDKKMEGLADKGNGNYAYIDSLREGRKVLVDEAAGTLVTIAKDVKLQIEFNPARVAAYRLVGYENRTLAAADFANDAKDAGDLGSGHAVTALYEIVPAGGAAAPGTELRYQRTVETTTAAAHSDELCVVKLRWKLPEGDVSTYREIPVTDAGAGYAKASGDFKFAAAVASFGMLLRGSPHRGQATLDTVMELATDGLDFDPNGLRAEFVDLVRRTKAITGR